MRWTAFARRKDDRGATLIIVLIIITFVGVVTGVVMSQVDTSVRASVGLRNETSNVYGGDAAAQVAINQLRAGTFPGSNCSTTTPLVIPNFYPSVNGAPGASAAVRCTPDLSNAGSSGGGGANSSPGSAILTLGTGVGGERGIYVNSSNNQSVKVHGGIFSDSSIFLEGNKSDLENTNTTNSYVFAMGTCTSSGTSRIISTPAATCNYSSNPISSSDRRGKDPGTIANHGLSFDPPSGPLANGSVLPATCASPAKVFEFQPGLYSSAAALNAFTAASGAGCSGSVWHFNPGVYYFNFTDAGSHQWVVNNGYLVGGAANTAISPFNVAKVGTAASNGTPFCKVPTVGGPIDNQGVEFVFGGDSSFYVTKGTNGTNPNVQVCASNSPSGPPIAFYGLKTSVGSGAFSVPAQSGCITQTGYVAEGGDGTHCAVIQTTNDPNPALTIYGTTYVPNAAIDLYLNNNTVQVFRWGLVARTVLIGSTGSAGLGAAVIDVPDDAPAPFALPTYYYLDVFLCPGQATCSTSGSVALSAKVQLSPAAPFTAKVLSWSQR